jgi:putative ABC transport system permease protein
MITRLAFRNLLRNRRRSIITLTAIVFGCMSLIVIRGFFAGMTRGLANLTIHSGLGHIQIRARGFAAHRTTDPLRYLMRDFDGFEQGLHDVPGYRGTLRSIEFGGLLTTDEASVSVIGVGVEPQAEAALMTAMSLSAGNRLATDDPLGVIVGSGLAAALRLDVDQTVTLLTSTRDGSINGRSLRVRGIYSTGLKEFDDRTLRLPLATAQALLDVEGMIMTAAVVLDRTEDTAPALAEVRRRVQAAGLNFEVVPWFELADFYDRVVKFFDTVYRVIAVIVGVVMLLGIANTMTMAVFERTREIGTALAIGTPPSAIMRIFLMEGLLVGASGTLVGGALAVIVAAVLGRSITLPALPGASQPLWVEIVVVPYHLLATGMVCVGAALLSSFLPALRAARLQITDALRHV